MSESIREWDLSDEPIRSLTEAQVRDAIGSAGELIQVLQMQTGPTGRNSTDRWAYRSGT